MKRRCANRRLRWSCEPLTAVRCTSSYPGASGAPALHRWVFDPLPGQGRWATVLLADGNIGIGGLPARLLHRCAPLLAPSGRTLIEAEPGNGDEQLTAWLEHPDGRRGPVFPWARMGMPALLRATEDVGLQ